MVQDKMSPYGVYGKRLIPNIVEQAAILEPQRLVMIQARSSNVSEGFNYMTMKHLSQTSNFMAHWIESKIGKSSNFETISFVGDVDFRYPIMQIAAMKTKFPVSIPSHLQKQLLTYPASGSQLEKLYGA
jgi:hypothetical protein